MRRRGLLLYVARRLAALVAVLAIVSLVIFTLLYLAPGSPEQLLLGPREATPASVAAIREHYHLNDPFLVRYWDWGKSAVRLDFGRSIRTNETVTSAIGRRLRLSLQLGGLAFAVALLVGVPLGVLAASRRRTGSDRAIVGVSVVGVSAPAFATGTLLLYVFAVRLGWFPVFGQGSGLGGRLW